MKNYFLLLICVITLAYSCSEDGQVSIETDLVGEWSYERETFSSNSTFIDPDTIGTIIFLSDETGEWKSNAGLSVINANSIEWDLQRQEAKIAITKIYSENQSPLFDITRIYSLTRNNRNSFTLRYRLELFSTLGSLEESSLQYENIYLTRK